MNEPELRAVLSKTARQTVIKGLNQGASGNVSVRLRDGFLITPSGLPNDTLEPAQMVFVDMEGQAGGSLKPSSEWRIHRDLYRARPEVAAVVHAHSTSLVAFSVVGQPLTLDQFRGDYVEKFGQNWTGGLRRLMDQGAWYREAAYRHLATVTCVGHTTVVTGSLPRTHGIIGNDLWDREAGRGGRSDRLGSTLSSHSVAISLALNRDRRKISPRSRLPER